MKVGQRIRKRRKELGLTAEQVAERLGKNRATIYRYESNGIENLPSAVLEPLAKVLQTTPAELMGWSSTNVADTTLDYTVPELKEKKKEGVPLLGTIAAGLPILAEENIEEYFDIAASIKADFALRIKGNSMIDAGINDGDIAFLRKQQTLETGEIGAIVIDNEATLKRFYKTNSSIVLQPENKDYQPIIITDGDLQIAGKLVAVLNIVK